MVSPATYVNIQAVQHSGSTLLAVLLGAHPQISTIGEMDGLKTANIETYKCSCKQKIKECDFWRSITTAMHDRGFSFDVANFGTRFEHSGSQFIRYFRLYPLSNNTLNSIRDGIFEVWPGQIHQLKTTVARNEALIDSVLNLTGTSVFVDSSKAYLRFSHLRRFGHLDVRVIHLIRDVRGVTASHLRRHPELRPAEVARKWQKKHRWLEKSLAALPAGSVLQIRYEDLCRDVPATLEKIHRFCGVTPQVDNVDFEANPYHIIGNSMRMRFNSEIKLDERWRTTLTAEQLAEIERVAGDLNRRYGYK